MEADSWTLDSQPSLIGELQNNERASISEEVGKWPPEDVTGWGVGGQEEREERENLMTSSLNAWDGQ